jgi:hypothetical protein
MSSQVVASILVLSQKENLCRRCCLNRDVGSVLISLLYSVAPGKIRNNDISKNVTIARHLLT